MAPISFDGTDVTGITVDGDDVQEVTMDGDVVWVAETLIDSFEDGDLSEYSQSGGNWEVEDESNAATNAKDGSKLLKGDPGGDTANEALYSTSGLNTYPSPGDTFKGWARTGDDTSEDDEQGPFVYFAVASGAPRSGGRGYQAGITNSGSSLDDTTIKRMDTDGSVTTLASDTSHSYSMSTWYEFEVDWATDGTITFTTYNESGTQLNSVSATDTNYSDGGFGVEHGSGSATSGFSTAYWDYWRVV